MCCGGALRGRCRRFAGRGGVAIVSDARCAALWRLIGHVSLGVAAYPTGFEIVESTTCFSSGYFEKKKKKKKKKK
eukprot:NODE_6427_length_507_cov_188.446903.p2 GENE.NODE_6427_length_507_cov_188.446903~~NODE_6427_length_507_cov_188.446903.p2  ORF type:complete len:75 (+),score=37.90 NODE_6427_length_507_cov_188.446903:228-452(+)